MMPCAQGQDEGEASHESVVIKHFDLPAQPLVEALHAYAHMTNVLVIAQTTMVAGHNSAALHGDYSPHDALQLLLAGTGLQANFSARDEAVVVPAEVDPPAPAAPPAPGIAADAIDGVMAGGDYRAYVAMIQTRLTEKLCASAATRPGDYRLVAQLRIDAAGAISAARVATSTGTPERNAAIERALLTLVLDAPPPPGFPEPVTLLLRPRGDGVDTDCAQFGG